MKDVFWVYLVCGFLAIMVMAGGSSLPSHDLFVAQSWMSLAVLGFAIWRLRDNKLDGLAASGLTILAVGFVTMLAQLIPLPQTIWSVLGGRAFVVTSFELVRQTGAWLSLSLSPNATRQDILALLPAAAIFVSLFTIPREGRVVIALTICALAMASLLLSLVQPGAATVSAQFINPNFFAALLYMSIPFAIALGSRSEKKSLWAVSAIVVLLCFVGIGQTSSRFGLLTAFGVSVASALSFQKIGRTSALYGLPVITILIVMALLFGGTGIERFTGLQAAFAQRADIFSTSVTAFFSFLPAGSGFGSFVPIYQMYEASASITPSYVNHAHNDWLELLLEGGLLMAVLMVAYLRWFVLTLKAVWAHQFDFGKAASISAIAVMLHSLADYPLRSPALLVLFACCCGLMVRAAAPQNSKESLLSFDAAFTRAGAVTA